ncbi:MAG TPA: hypothetical protein VL986_06620 [Terracidiphilus sp.]|nr:hypothetical protein [Terracidiphilus sp.]
MKNLSRRQFISSAAFAIAATSLKAQNASANATLTIPAQATGARVPADFIGLSYEVQQLVDPAFFSAANTGLVNAFKAISPHGVLRLGGNTSEFEYWKPTPDSPEPAHPETRVVVGEPKPSYYPVTAEAINNLGAFLNAAGWKCIYGIGMGTNTPGHAADEAEYVAKTLGPQLEYFQIGNEADLFGNHLRDPKTWGVKTYLDEWLAIARAVGKAVPGSRFGMPDVASRIDWLTQIADAWPSITDKPNVTTLSHHHYFGGPATNPAVNIPNLLSAANMARVQKTADLANAAAAKMGVPVRMTEGNTCYRGGKPGVSDVQAAALWGANYSLLLAANRYSGVNLHGGTGKSVANSVGGSLPGDEMLAAQGVSPEEIARHPHPFYTPIATFGAEYAVQPVGYGLVFAGAFAGATMFAEDLTTPLASSGVNAMAYGAQLGNGKASVIVLNKDEEKDLELTLDFGGRKGKVQNEALHAPDLASRETAITRPSFLTVLKGGKCSVTVPHASGMRLTLV